MGTIDSEQFWRQIWQARSRVETVLRGHLWVEFFLDRLLTGAFERPGEIDLDRTPWRYKLSLCAALGLLPEDAVQGLGRLNALRNSLSHDLLADPSDEDFEQLIGISPPRWRAVAKEMFDPAEEDEQKRSGGLHAGDEALGKFQAWLFAVLLDLEYASASQQYQQRHRTELIRAASVELMHEYRGEPISWEDAIAKVGLPPPPKFGDGFKSSAASVVDD